VAPSRAFTRITPPQKNRSTYNSLANGLYPLAGLIGIIWWPLGLAAMAAVFFRDLRKAKQARLYCCKACDIKLSYEEALSGEKHAT